MNVICGTLSPMIAKIVEKYFDGFWISSFEHHSWNLLPDTNLLSPHYYAQVISSIKKVSRLPIWVDGNEGGPDLRSVTQLVEQCVKAGAHGVCLEDNTYPKVCSFHPSQKNKLEEVKKFVQKLQAVKNFDSSFHLIARTESLVCGCGLDLAIDRAKAYSDAGCDLFLIHSIDNSPKEIFEFADRYRASHLTLPLACIPTKFNMVNLAELEHSGFDFVIYANYALRNIMKNVDKMFARIHQAGTLSAGDDCVVELHEVFGAVGPDKL